MKFIALAASGLALALTAPAVHAATYIRLIDIVSFPTRPGVYSVTMNIYQKDDQGREIPDSQIKFPMLVNCTNATAASQNTDTGELQILPLTRRFTVGKFCERRYGWMGD